MHLQEQAECHLNASTRTGMVPFKCSYKERHGAI